MSTFAKVLVVLIFVASGILLGVTATLFAYRTDYKAELAKTREQAKKDVALKDVEIQKCQDEMSIKESQLNAHRMAAEGLRTQLAASRNDAKNWQDKYSVLFTELGKLNDQVKAITEQITEKDKVIAQLTVDLQTARSDEEGAKKDKDAADQRVLDLQTRLTAAEKNLIELEKSYIVLERRLEGGQ